MTFTEESFLVQWLLSTWDVIAISSLWLLAGFFIAGVLHVFMPRRMIERHLKKPGFFSVLKSSAFGIPLPLCSCSVIPVGVSLRKHGASRGATASFFISTPEIGVDSFLLSYALLGPFFAVMRVITAFFAALSAGWLIDSFPAPESATGQTAADTSDDCCHTASDRPEEEHSSKSKLYRVLHFGYVEILDDLSTVLCVGFLLAGLAAVLLPADSFAALGLGPVSSMFLMLFVSLPVYVCATSLTPLAAALIAKGLGLGAALVFLLAGPATNITTMLVVRRELGTRALVFYLLSIITTALLAGFYVNSVVVADGIIASKIFEDIAHVHQDPISLCLGLFFTLLLLLSLYRKV